MPSMQVMLASLRTMRTEKLRLFTVDQDNHWLTQLGSACIQSQKPIWPMLALAMHSVSTCACQDIQCRPFERMISVLQAITDVRTNSSYLSRGYYPAPAVAAYGPAPTVVELPTLSSAPTSAAPSSGVAQAGR